MLTLLPRSAKVKTRFGVKEYTYYAFTTKSLALLNSAFSQWYIKNSLTGRNIKFVPVDIYQMLTPVGLAH
jgi:hypothetical protein